MRSLIYWMTSAFVAVVTANAADHLDAPTVVAQGASLALLAVPDTGRSVILAAGILAMAFTYRHAWNSFRARP